MDPTNGWVVIAAYKEGRAMRRIVERVQSAGYPVVVVDNGSPDRTFEEARAGGAFVMRHPTRVEVDAALKHGIDFAHKRGASHVFTFSLDSESRTPVENPARETSFATKLFPISDPA